MREWSPMEMWSGWIGLWAQAEAPATGLEALLRSPVPLLVMLATLGYLMIFKPEQRRKTDHATMLNNLKKNDRIETIGGIIGTIVSVNREADEVVIKVDESSNTRLRIRCSAVKLTGDSAPKRGGNRSSVGANAAGNEPGGVQPPDSESA